jgi:hypothetical protein
MAGPDLSEIWKRRAARFRACARTTDEAERQRFYLVLAERCEEIARAPREENKDL